jgi:cytoskeletal protein CcmA (bactofilin family)
MDNIVSIEEQDFTMIGKHCTLSGKFNFDGATHLAGGLEGEIHIQDKSLLTFESTSNVKGKVFCGDLKIYGTVDGEIYSNGLVEVFPTGKMTGLINAKNLVVHPGAILNFDGHTAGL